MPKLALPVRRLLRAEVYNLEQNLQVCGMGQASAKSAYPATHPCVIQMYYTEAMATITPEQRLRDVIEGKTQNAGVTMRVNAEDASILVELMKVSRAGVTDVLRRGIRRVQQEQWEDQLRREAATLADEDLNAEADAW